MPYVDGDGEKKVCELFAIYVNVTTKKMTKALFDGEEISGRNAAALLFFYNLSANHVKVRGSCFYDIYYIHVLFTYVCKRLLGLLFFYDIKHKLNRGT